MFKSQKGFHLAELAIAVVVIGLVGVIAYMFISNSSAGDDQTTVKTSDGGTKEVVRWAYDQNKMEWYASSGTPHKCRDPFTFDMTPVDMSRVVAVGLPGAYRGFNYKPHGLFRMDDDTNGNTEVKMPIDATLVGLTRYYEGDPAELQYLLTFETDCGIAFRFDHLHTLAPEFQAIAETTPEPKLNDTSSNPDDAPDSVAFEAGEVIATKVGFVKTRNYGFDFGVYDYRQRNDISNNAKWADIHRQYSSLDWHGVCWLDMLPGGDAAKAKAMAKDRNNYDSSKPFHLTSDYCNLAPHRTLDFNDGRPTDG